MKHPLKAIHQLSDFKGVRKRATDMQSVRLCEKKSVDKKIGMRYINHMDIGKALKQLIAKKGKSFRKTANDLQIDRASLQRSLKEGSNPEWKTIEKVLDYLGYEIRIVRKRSRVRKS